MRFWPAPNPTPLWRDEFAIGAADERYVTRRQFAKFLTLTSLGMAVGQLWILAKGWFQPAPAFPAAVVARAADVPVGGVQLFHYPGADDPCILVRLAEEHYVAYSQKCTHLSCAVYYAAETRRLACPCHRGFFAVEDGRVLQGPPPRPLPRIVLRRRGDDLVAAGVEVRRA
ncbi:MAG: ubiquinol-cytochrome c reductase iron-sulfur subunit [Candidatus Methylomirabilales bacterium]